MPRFAQIYCIYPPKHFDENAEQTGSLIMVCAVCSIAE